MELAAEKRPGALCCGSLILLAAACHGRDLVGVDENCPPLAMAPCTCDDGRAGIRVCTADGRRWSACGCEGSIAGEDAAVATGDAAAAEAGFDAASDPCGGCSGHGVCQERASGVVCACRSGYSPSSRAGLDCVPTSQVCAGGAIDYDYDGDGNNDTWFEPNADECLMFELVNSTRALHDDEGHPECHWPLMWSVRWSAHARNHSLQMAERGYLFHGDVAIGQNCAAGCGPACEMNNYMNGDGEDHCPDLSHHCNIMSCDFSAIGIGYVGTWNTQNFL
ncbi:MAG: CAP domain-containing protein [Deltaproteobacteria bacterium]|nr:CAP domain-containing protein [Deltaproteobacteria bacterium]